MNLQNIFNEIEKADPEIYERLDSRRHVMHRFKNLGGKLALTAIPLALGNMLNKAYGQTSSNIVDILNFALTLEYLESDFYTQGLNFPGFVQDVDAFNLISQHEAAHVAFLTKTITGLQGTPVTKPEFDFTANGTYHTFTNYETFLQLSQAFEDTGVRAYKGQAQDLISNNDVLTAALQIHSVEARHAAHVRMIRRTNQAAPNEKPWITGNNASGLNSFQATYDGEENVMQLSIDISKLPGANPTAATEAFDEPLTMDEVNAIIQPFIK
jgi:hypothetical protein